MVDSLSFLTKLVTIVRCLIAVQEVERTTLDEKVEGNRKARTVIYGGDLDELRMGKAEDKRILEVESKKLVELELQA